LFDFGDVCIENAGLAAIVPNNHEHHLSKIADAATGPSNSDGENIIQTDALFLDPLRWRAHPELARPKCTHRKAFEALCQAVSETAIYLYCPHFSAL
jgi:hypothetical protein